MLPEPDLFASVNKDILTQDHQCEVDVLLTNACTTVSIEHVNRSPLCDDAGLTQLVVSDRPGLSEQNINLVSHLYNWSSKNGLSGGDHSNKSCGVQNSIFYERRARRWYLIVIVLLYIGMITSFCLNVSLLLRSHSELYSPQEQGFDEFVFSQGKLKLARHSGVVFEEDSSFPQLFQYNQ